MQRTARTVSALGATFLLIAVSGCAGAPEAVPEPTPEPAQEEAVQQEQADQQIADLQEELGRLREELRTTRRRLEAQESEEAAPGPESQQLQRENERLRELVEELRLALIAADGANSLQNPPTEFEPARTPPREPTPREPTPPEPAEPEPEPATSVERTPSFRQVPEVNAPLRSETPNQLASQGIERIPRDGGGYHYVDATSNDAAGEGVYLELTLLPGMELPEARLRAKTVYPAQEEPLMVRRVSFSLGGQEFELEPETVERVRNGRLLAETASFPLTPQVRRLLTLTQRRPEEDMTVRFFGETGEQTHAVTRRERLALANMIYTLREMGGKL